MKKPILYGAAVLALGFLSGCTTVVDPEPTTTSTTTTETTSLQRPVTSATTTETQSVRY